MWTAAAVRMASKRLVRRPPHRSFSNAYDLTGRKAVITGGAQGIGFAVAERLLKSGASSVTLWDMDDVELTQAVEMLSERAGSGQEVNGVVVNVADEKEVNSAMLDGSEVVDILVASAGITGANECVAKYPLDQWTQVMNVNLTGVFLCNRAVLPGMIERGYGRIVNVASVAGKEGNPNAAAYSASKAGVMALTKSISKETASLDIACNCVTPAAAKTRIFDQMKEEHIQYMLSKIPRERFLKVEEAASMISFLVSAENSFTTGSAFDLSGGRATY
jgi:NAD(P)-dependent dehydrogenase (short-subunit alcohol dehydrogenase family)